MPETATPWINELIDRLNQADNWVCQLHDRAQNVVAAVSELGYSADDKVADLVGCLIEEIVRLRTVHTEVGGKDV